jgi:SPP1 gp7 family putative phage head morphogenesis protein
MTTIKPQPLHDADWADMETQLKKIFFDLIFRQILDLLIPQNAQVKAAAKEMRNAGTASVVAAIRAGRIQLTQGVFSGDFNSVISKQLKGMGAKWNKITKTFSLPVNQVPPDVAAIANEYAAAAKKMHAELDKRLAEIGAQLSSKVASVEVDAGDTVERVAAGFKKTAGKTMEDLGADSDLTPEGKERISKEYTEDLKPYIQKFADETINELRQMVADNAKVGYRFDKLVDRIQSRYDVSRTKAKFLARQETGLLVSKHRQVRFEDVGITRYIWRTSGLPNVRDDHKSLNGREFLYSQPPVVDKATGRRANPGQDFNCRCVDEPILPAVGVAA